MAPADFLGSPYLFRGEVMHGDKRGRTLGFPTANLVPPNELCYPGHGIYACRAAVDSTAMARVAGGRQRRRAPDSSPAAGC